MSTSLHHYHLNKLFPFTVDNQAALSSGPSSRPVIPLLPSLQVTKALTVDLPEEVQSLVSECIRSLSQQKQLSKWANFVT